MDQGENKKSLSDVSKAEGIKLFTSERGCCGCTACRNICPQKAISMRPDEKGFLYPRIDPALCVNCGLCGRVCPMKQEPFPEKVASEPEFYAVKHRSDEIRMKSSSGGMFTAVSDWILEQGGTVYGAAFDDDFKVCHRRATTKAERDAFRGSKYVQSDLNGVFSQVKNDLACGRAVLFSGTPCQAAGLSLFLARTKADTGRLYLCDLVCHGTPSPQIFSDYLTEAKRKYNSEIQLLTFRYKPAGWRTQAVRIDFCSRKFYQSSVADDIYYSLFLPNIILRPSCYHCPFASLRRPSDLTIGDFWGIEKSMPEFEDEKGVSLVLVHTQKGKRLFQSVEGKLEARPLRPEQGMQWNLRKPSVPSPKTDAFWADYRKHGFEFVANRYAQGGIKGKIKSGIKKALKQLGLFDAVCKIVPKKVQ